jgi:co-chaperonin GroES (HSP10)
MYPTLEVKKIKGMVEDKVLINWDEAKADLAGGRLIRPETHRGMHYTGKVLLKGPNCQEDFEVGDRILFEGFANSFFERYKDPKLGRIAIIREHEVMAVIPERVEISNSEGDFDYNA